MVNKEESIAFIDGSLREGVQLTIAIKTNERTAGKMILLMWFALNCEVNETKL